MKKASFRSIIDLAVVFCAGFSAHATPTCPDGYAKVPGNSRLGTSDFCVMKYEAKARQIDSGEIKENGCDGTGAFCNYGTSNWGLNDHKPVSVEQGRPWRRISRDNAINACQSLGQGYDLISNAEWQTIARNIENQAVNWSGQRVGSGCISRGNSAGSACGYRALGLESGRDARATHTLSSGEEIYHFSGNVSEWVKDNITSRYFSGYISSFISGEITHKFGPEGYYTTCNSQNDYCGMGFGWLWNVYDGASAVDRGGSIHYSYYGGARDAGVFAARLGADPSGSGFTRGFRCVFTPEV
ncbi:MAG: SUMF1/EgtB/PvdO family nonheme iron enzyme, partial [Bdellovibrionales bacterium]|nr:SUMF1/EgtB/PvdO family nonheme iron enzyme [Bdellovibrionales bacterium]